MAKDKAKPVAQAGEASDWITRSIRFPPELYARIEREAAEARRSTQLQIIWMLEELLRREEADPA